jgi:hypothetical protein
LIKPCWEELNLDLKKVRNMIIYDKLKNVGKIVKNSYEPILSNTRSFSFFENRGNPACYLNIGTVF